MISLKNDKSPNLKDAIENEAKIIPFPNQQKPKNNAKLLLRKRTYAFLIDLYVIVLIKVIMTLSYTTFLKAFFFQLPMAKQKMMLENLQVADMMVTPVIFFTYFFFSYFAGEGKTIGKIFLKISVVNHSQSSLTLKESFMRSMGYGINYMTAGLLFLLPFFRKDARGIPDMISKTMIKMDEELVKVENQFENVVTIETSSLPQSENQKEEEKKVA